MSALSGVNHICSLTPTSLGAVWCGEEGYLCRIPVSTCVYVLRCTRGSSSCTGFLVVPVVSQEQPQGLRPSGSSCLSPASIPVSQTRPCFEAGVYVPDCACYERKGRRRTGRQGQIRDL